MPERLLHAPHFNGSAESKAGKLRQPETRAEIFDQTIRARLEGMSPNQRVNLANHTKEKAYGRGLFIKEPAEDGNSEKNKAIPFDPIPKLFDRDKMEMYARDVTAVYGAMARIEDFALAGETNLGREIFSTIINGMSSEETELTNRAKSRPSHTARRRNARADAFVSADGMSIIEVNNVNPEGILYHHVLTASAKDFLDEVGLDHPDLDHRFQSAAQQVHKMLRDEYADRTEGEIPGKIGFVYEQEKDDAIVNRAELPLLSALYSSQFVPSFEVVHGDPKDVEASNGKMTVKGEEVDMIWRNAIDVPAVFRGAPGMVEVMSHPERYPQLNDATSALIGSKVMLSYLHDERVQTAIGMTDAEKAAVLRTVPFTFIPGEDVFLGVNGQRMSSKEYLTRFQEYFVLKPGSGTHGEDIHFGANSNNGWSSAVEEAVASGTFVAQRFVSYKDSTENVLRINDEGDLIEEPFVRDINLHHINGKAVGTTISRIVPAPSESEEITPLNIAGGGGFQATVNI